MSRAETTCVEMRPAHIAVLSHLQKNEKPENVGFAQQIDQNQTVFLKKNRHTTNIIYSTAREVVAWLAGPAQWAIPR